MKFHVFMLLAVVKYCLAAQFSMDASCDGKRDELIVAFVEGVELAENAFIVMDQHRSDEQVDKMLKLVLGDDDFDNKLTQAKSTFERVKAFAKQPSPFKPQDQGWLDQRSNVDVELYCDDSRFDRKEDNDNIAYDNSMQRRIIGLDTVNACYDPTPGKTFGVKMSTLSSDQVDWKGYTEAGGPGSSANKGDYMSPSPYACTIDICTWFVKATDDDEWPKFDATRLEILGGEQGHGLFPGDASKGDKQVPMDVMRTIGCTFLHELTHTNQGGRTIDQNSPDSYGWAAVTKMQSTRNADNIAMLGMALKIWTMGYYVDAVGVLNPLP